MRVTQARKIAVTDNVIILGFVTLTIFSLMLAIGLNHSFEPLTFLWSRPALLLRSLLAVLVTPLILAIFSGFFELPTVVIIIMVGVSPAIGHLLSGPPQERRSVLAVAGKARNVGLALFIANLSDYGQQFIPTLLTCKILGALPAVPTSVWSKRQMTAL